MFVCFSLLFSAGHLLQRLTSSDPLENGTVLSQGSSFTYQDVLAGLVGYMPGDSGVAVDDFQFSLTDGLHVDTGRMEIYIGLPISDSPRLTVNRGLQLSAGSTGGEEMGHISSLLSFSWRVLSSFKLALQHLGRLEFWRTVLEILRVMYGKW